MNSQEPLTRLSADVPAPLLLADYAAAEVTVVYNRTQAARTWLFGVVEFLPAWLERVPEPGFEAARRLGEHELNVRRVCLPPAQGLDWYLECRSGRAVLPSLPEDKVMWSLAPGELWEDPPWPYLVLEDASDGFWETSPLWGHRPGGTRVHQLVARTPPDPAALWTETELQTARDWLAEQIPVPVLDRTVLRGSVALVAANPLFGKVETILGDDDTTVLVEIQPYPGRPLADLELRLTEKRPAGVCYVASFKNLDRYNEIALPFTPHMQGLEIHCPRRGLLYREPPSAFLRRITVATRMSAAGRRVTVPARSRRRPAETYEVAVGSMANIGVGDPPGLPGAADLLASDRHRARIRARAASLGQRWFDGNVDEATELVRSLISQATSEVLIVDGYFADTELMRFGLASGTRGVSLRILTSAECMRKKYKEDDPAAGERGDMLLATLDQIHAVEPSASIEIRVAKGKKPPIHDRFLRVDDRLWLVGSSLNELGSRGTMMVQVPDPDMIVPNLERMWSSDELSQSLNKFVTARRSARRRLI